MANFSTDGSICIERHVEIGKYQNFLDFNKEFDIEDVSSWINNNGYSKVCLQFPDGLLHISARIYEYLRNKITADLFIQADTTFSSCCVDEVTAMHVQADAVVHYGHTCLSSSSIPVFYSLPKLTLNKNLLADTLHKHSDDIISEKMCLFYDAAYDHLKDEIEEVWYQQYSTGYIAYVNTHKTEITVVGRQVKNKEQKCISKEEFEGFTCVYIGKHSQTLFNCVISVNAAKWLLLDLNTGEVSSLSESLWFKRRRYLIEKCKDATKVGILVCKMAGQSTKDIIKRMKEICKISNKKSYIISVGKPNVAKLANFPEIDIYVLVACPENELYSSRDFYKPLVYPYELELAVNIKRPYQHNIHISDFEQLLDDGSDINVEKEGNDVSLISGRIRGIDISSTSSTSLEKSQWAVEAIGDHLLNKSWTGLEQKLGETSIRKFELGRSGLPVSYENEPLE